MTSWTTIICYGEVLTAPPALNSRDVIFVIAKCLKSFLPWSRYSFHERRPSPCNHYPQASVAEPLPRRLQRIPERPLRISHAPRIVHRPPLPHLVAVHKWAASRHSHTPANRRTLSDRPPPPVHVRIALQLHACDADCVHEWPHGDVRDAVPTAFKAREVTTLCQVVVEFVVIPFKLVVEIVSRAQLTIWSKAVEAGCFSLCGTW